MTQLGPNHGPRQSGRTTRMIASANATDRAIVICMDRHQVDEMRKLGCMRPVIPLSYAMGAYLLPRWSIPFVDHYVWEVATADQLDWLVLEMDRLWLMEKYD